MAEPSKKSFALLFTLISYSVALGHSYFFFISMIGQTKKKTNRRERRVERPPAHDGSGRRQHRRRLRRRTGEHVASRLPVEQAD